MQIKQIAGTPHPERLVSLCARNDYRADGVIDHSFAEIMAGVKVDDDVVDDLREEWFDDDDVARDDPWDAMPAEFRTEAEQRSLLKHTMNEGHWGVFEHPQATLALEGITRTSMAQITRHRHFTFDIMSLRYVTLDFDSVEEMKERFAEPDEITAEEVVSRNGVETIDMDPDEREEIWWETIAHTAHTYNTLVDAGVPQEEARKVLGMGTKVNIMMSGNARAWMHLLNIRGKANVQGEARNIADGVMGEMKEWMPYTFERYDDMLPLRLNP